MHDSSRKQRRAVRFAPGPLDHAQIMFRVDARAFRPDAVALIMDQAGKGAQIVLKDHAELALNLRVTVQIGRLDPQLATIVWIKNADAELRRVGLEFVER